MLRFVTRLVPVVRHSLSPIRAFSLATTSTHIITTNKTSIETPEQVRQKLLRTRAKSYACTRLPSMSAGEFELSYSCLSAGQSLPLQVVRQNGRVVSIREAGSKLIFIDIVCADRRLQIKASRTNFACDNDFSVCRAITRGDVISSEGFPGVSSNGQLSLCARTLDIIAPCMHPLPKIITDSATISHNKHIDLLVNDGVKQRFVMRSKVIRTMRAFFDARGFTEVETPILWPTSGGASATPFETKGKALGKKLEMRVAPELFLKQLVVGGFDRVYELGKVFRNEGVDRTHHPEFTSCEFYMANTDYNELFTITEELLSSLDLYSKRVSLTGPFRRIEVVPTLQEELRKLLGRDNINVMDLIREDSTASLRAIFVEANLELPSPPTASSMLDKLLSDLVEPLTKQEPTFLVNHPSLLSPLAKAQANEPLIAERFELFIEGKELCNAYSELNDPDEQRRRFAMQQRCRNDGDSEAQRYDEQYCRVLEYGLPPTAGWGIGIDRLIMLLADVSSIRDVLLFRA